MDHTQPDLARKYFSGRKLVIGTKHEKDKVIAPVIERITGATCFVAPDFDTDGLGTFTGEVDREDDPLTTVRKKCLLAMESSDCDLGIASEGSFGAHPSSFLIPADEELLIFIDGKNGIEVVASELSTSTNFKAEEITSEKQLREFARRAGFPSHGLILRRSHEDNTDIVKGITDLDTLIAHYHRLNKMYGEVFAETDMRAMFNPTRMQVIARLAEKLADNILSCCPGCGIPGFNVTDVRRGLPCSYCHSPTRSVLSHIYVCRHCHHQQEKMYPQNKKFCDPTYCDYCNP